MRWMTLLVAVTTWLCFSQVGHAEPGAIVVVAKGVAHDPDIVRSAAARVLGGRGWTTVEKAFTARAASVVTACLQNPTPWGCVSRIAQDKGARWIAIVSLDSQPTTDGAGEIRIVERMIVADGDRLFVELRYCQRCTDDTLTSLVGEATQAILDRIAWGHTVLSVKSTPSRARFSVDDEPATATDAKIYAVPGKHTVTIERDGFKPVTRMVELVEGKTTEISVTLEPVAINDEKRTSHPDPASYVVNEPPESTTAAIPASAPNQRSRALPASLIGFGTAAIVAGAITISFDQKAAAVLPGGNQPFETVVPGIVLGAAGVVAVGIGGYLWWKYSESSATPTISPVSGGAVVGMTTTF